MGKSARACLIISVSLLAATLARAADVEMPVPGLNLSLKSGVSSGRIIRLNPSGNSRMAWGGLPFAVAAAFPVQRWLTLSTGVGILYDVNHDRISRKGFDLTNEFHLLGRAQGFEKYGATSQHTLSALARLGLQFYDAQDAELGGLVEASFGASYRYGFGASSVALNVLTTPGGVSLGESFSVALYSAELEWRWVL